MKQKLLILLLTPLLLWACKENEECPCNEYVEITFQLNGEWTEDQRSPIPHGVNDLYGIDVRQEDGTPYAYGLFDDINKARLKLKRNEKYTIRIVAAPESKESCAYLDVSTGLFGGIFFNSQEQSYLGNTFLYKTGYWFDLFDKPRIHEQQLYKGYIPLYQSKKNDVVSFDMKRCFGFVQFSIKNFNSGLLRISFFFNSKIPDWWWAEYNLTKEDANAVFPYSYIPENETEGLPDDFSFIDYYNVRYCYSEFSEEYDLGNFPTTIYKNKTTKIEIDLSEFNP
jgi:hypothetical protein